MVAFSLSVIEYLLQPDVELRLSFISANVLLYVFNAENAYPRSIIRQPPLKYSKSNICKLRSLLQVFMLSLGKYLVQYMIEFITTK